MNNVLEQPIPELRNARASSWLPIHLGKQKQAEPFHVFEAIKNKTDRERERERLRERGKEFPHCTLEILHKRFSFKPTHHSVWRHSLWITWYHPTRHPTSASADQSVAISGLPSSHKLRDKYLKDPSPFLVGWARRQLICP